MWVYHYTTLQGLVGIQRDGVIRASTSSLGDANGGEGVYFTTLGPEEPDGVIIRGCWDRGAGENPNLLARVQVALGFYLPRSSLTRPQNAAGRDLWMHRGDFRIDGDFPSKVVRRF